MKSDEVNPEYTALLDQIDGARRQYQSFPTPHALSQDEEHSFEARAKYKLSALTLKLSFHVECFLETLRSFRPLRDEGSSTSSDCEGSACFGRVCALPYMDVCRYHAHPDVLENPKYR